MPKKIELVVILVHDHVKPKYQIAKIVVSKTFKDIYLLKSVILPLRNLQLILFLKHLKRCIWRPKCDDQEEEDNTEIDITDGSLVTLEPNDEAFGFTVKEAVLFPPEVEKGMWPENYSLSDHAPLTVVFSPVRMPCSPRNPRTP